MGCYGFGPARAAAAAVEQYADEHGISWPRGDRAVRRRAGRARQGRGARSASSPTACTASCCELGLDDALRRPRRRPGREVRRRRAARLPAAGDRRAAHARRRERSRCRSGAVGRHARCRSTAPPRRSPSCGAACPETLGERAAGPRVTKRRLFGIDRSGPPPDATLSGQPLNPWTIPNAIGFVRLAAIPVFLVVALSSDDGQDALAVVLFAVIGWADYLDGFAARLTGQYSRLGALLDPIVDRLLVVSGMVVCWHFELLPRWAIALVIARELFMLVAQPLRAPPRHRAQDQLGRADRGRADDGRAVLRDGRRPLAGADHAVRRDGVRADRDGAVRPPRGPGDARSSRRRGGSEPTLKLSLTLRVCAGYTAQLRRTPTRKHPEDPIYMDTFPDLGSLTDQELKELIKQLTDEEMEISYRAADPAREDRHPPRRAGQPPAQEGRERRARHHRRRRPAADRHPRRPRTGGPSRIAGARWPSTAQSAASPTPRAPTTASGAAPSWRTPSRRPGRPRPPTGRRDRRARGARVGRRHRARPGAGDPRRAAGAPARAFRSARDGSRSAAGRTATSSSTTSRSRATTRSSCAAATSSTSTTAARSTAPTSTAAGSSPTGSPTATSSRSASTSSRS